MDRDLWITLLKQHRAIAVLRALDVDTGVAMAKAVVAGGFRLIEITWNSDRPALLINRLRQTLPSDCVIGVGTVRSVHEMKAAIATSTEFAFSPYTDPEMIRLCQIHGIPITPGALTPTEIMTAWQSGASSVKVFPCQSLGGASYIRHLQGPLGHIPLIPTGGVTLEAGKTFLQAGAIAIGVSSSLFPKSLVMNGDWQSIQARSQSFLQSLD